VSYLPTKSKTNATEGMIFQLLHKSNDISLVNISVYSRAHLGRTGQRWEDIIKVNLKEKFWESTDYI
jgi:hypothetical protein